MMHHDLVKLLAQFFARLRHGLARHYGIPYIPHGQCGALSHSMLIIDTPDHQDLTTVISCCENLKQASEMKNKK